jgi:hypothetical protein
MHDTSSHLPSILSLRCFILIGKSALTVSDRGYGKPHQTQSIDANISEDGGSVRHYAEMPTPSSSTEEWVRDVEEYLAAKANG